jgi:hypothetical protein
MNRRLQLVALLLLLGVTMRNIVEGHLRILTVDDSLA